MTIFSREEAADRAESSTSNSPGTCQLWTRTMFNAPSAGDRDGDGDADAVDGWLSEPANRKHPGDRNPPRGVPVAWSGGSHGFGHRAISLGNGKIRSTDAAGSGHVATVDLGWVEANWGLHYLGWSETIDGYEIPLATPPKPSEPAADFTTAHASGLWSNRSEQWARLVSAVKDAAARLVTLTETTQDGLVREVTPKGWGSARNDAKAGQSECSILWSSQAWEDLGPAYSSKLATTRFKTGNGFLRPPVTAITKALGHKKSGLELLVTVLHAPSDVEGPTGFHGTAPRLAAYREAMDAVHESWAVGKGAHPDAARLLCGDWNLNYRLPWVRETWASEFPLLTPCWDLGLPERGTHGDRVIDWQAGSTQLRCVGAKVLPNVEGFDHRPLVAQWAVK